MSRSLTCPLPSDIFFFCCTFPLSLTTPKQSCPTHNLGCANPICASISCDSWDQPSYSLLLYFATTPYSSMQRRISVSSTPHVSLCGMSTPWLSTYFRQYPEKKRRELHLSESFLPPSPSLYIVLSTLQTPHSLCLPAFAPEAVCTVDLLHHSSTFYSPRYVFASVELRISPAGLVCTVHPFIQAVVHPPGLI